MEYENTKKQREAVKRVFKWEGIWKELPWILLFLLLFYTAWAYKRDVGLCQDVMKDPCYVECRKISVGISNITSIPERELGNFSPNG